MGQDAPLTCDWLEALKDCQVLPASLHRRALEHLTLCPACASEYAAWLEEADGAAHVALRPQAPPTTHTERGFFGAAAEEDPAPAERTLRLLAALPASECSRMIERRPERFSGLRLAERLLLESDRSLPAKARESSRFAGLAYQVAIRAGRPGLTAAARAVARKANAKRIAGKYRVAGDLLSFARQLIAEEVATTVVLAELDRFEGSLRLDEHRFADAESLLLRARRNYERLDETALATQQDLNLAFLYYERGEIPRAVRAGTAIYERLRRSLHPVLFLCAENNLALYLAAAGAYDEALFILQSDDDFCIRHGDRHTKPRRLWVAGRALAAVGDISGAEEMFRAVREAFLSEGLEHYAALVSLDLVWVYAKTGHLRELRRTVAGLPLILQSYGWHREAGAALRLLLEAAR